MEDEAWPTMQQDVESLKARVFLLAPTQGVGTLKDLCIESIVDRAANFCKAPEDSRTSLVALIDKKTPELYQEFLEGKFSLVDMVRDFDAFLVKRQEPFKDLPPSLMEELQAAFKEIDWHKTQRVLPCLVEKNMKKLIADISRMDWTDGGKNALLERIRDKGQNIQDLQFIVGGRLDADIFKGMFRSLTQLTKLDVQSDHFDDLALAVIGSTCPELRSISMSSSWVTDEGIRYLCEIGQPSGPNGEQYGMCQKLTYMDVYHTEVSTEGIVTALYNLPGLVYLNNDYLYDGVVKLINTDKSVTLKLQFMHLAPKLLEEDIQNDVIASVVSAVPDIKSLEINSLNIVNIDAFMKLEHVNILSFGVLKKISSTSLELLISHFCNQLTELKIDYFDNKIDITVIGFHCRQLQKLYWDSNCEEHCKYKLVPLVHFNKLEKAEFDIDDFSSNIEIPIPGSVIECILSSPNLKSFSLSNYPVQDSVFQSVIKKARLHSEIFSNLQELNLIGNFCEISPQSAKQIICLAHKLTKLTLEPDIADECSEFIEENDLDHCEIYDASEEDY